MTESDRSKPNGTEINSEIEIAKKSLHGIIEVMDGDLSDRLAVEDAIRKSVTLVRRLRVLSAKIYKRDGNDEKLKEILSQIISRDPHNFWAKGELEKLG